MDMETAMHLLDLKLDEDMRSGMHLLELKLDEEMRSWSVIEKERKDTEYVAVEPINNKSLSETEEKEERMKRIKRLVQEFAGDAPPSAEYIIGDRDVLERWFTELGGGWILELNNDGASAAAVIVDHTVYARNWIRVLSEITDTLVTPFFSGRGTCSMPSICEEEHETKQRGDQDSIPDQLQITEFIKETMLAMVAFVDVICRKVAISISSRVPAPYVMEKLSILLGVRFALSEALHK